MTKPARSLKILMLTSSYPKYPGDVTAPFIESIAQYSQARGHKVTVLMPFHPDLKRAPVENGVRFYQYKYALRRKWNIWGYASSLEGDVKVRKLIYLLLPFVLISSFWKLWRLTGQERYDLIQAHWVIPNAPVAILIGWLRRIPVVISLHGSDVYLAERVKPVGWVAKWAFGRSAAVTACSGDLLGRAQRLNAPQSPERAKVIPYGANTDIFQLPSEDRLKLRETLGFQPDETVLLCIGRLVYKKGFEYALRALPEVLKVYPKTRLVIGGAGDLLTSLQNLAQELGVSEQVRFEGSIPHNRVPEYLAACDIFLQPSIIDDQGNVDGLPNTLLEALAAGRPVIASEVAGINIAVQDGQNGRLVPQRDSQALAAAILELIGDPTLQEKFGQAGRQKIEQELNWPTTAARYSEIFEEATS